MLAVVYLDSNQEDADRRRDQRPSGNPAKLCTRRRSAAGYRHITPAMLAHAVLAVLARKREKPAPADRSATRLQSRVGGLRRTQPV
jgi:hypothetical protein